MCSEPAGLMSVSVGGQEDLQQAWVVDISKERNMKERERKWKSYKGEKERESETETKEGEAGLGWAGVLSLELPHWQTWWKSPSLLL